MRLMGMISSCLIFSALLAGCTAAAVETPGLTPLPPGNLTPVRSPTLMQATIQPQDTPTPAETEPLDTPGTHSPSYDPAMEPLVQLAREDLAGRLGIPENQIEVLDAESVVWSDTSMGCPQPGMEYLQVPQDGAFIVLQAGGSEYAYHSGGTRGLFLCEQTGKAPQITPLNPE